MAAFSFLFVRLLEDTSLREWNLEDNVVSATTDQGPNVKKCMALFSGISGATWLPCAAHKVQIAINNAWKEGGALPLLDKCRNISRMFKNKDAVADQLAKSQQSAGVDDIKPITMNETRWNSRYEMIKRIIKLKDHIDRTISHFTNSTILLPTHISLDELKSCSLSHEEFETLQDIKNLLEKASEYGNKMGASIIPTISTMYSQALTLLPDFSVMKTDIGKEVFRHLDAGIRSRWSLTPPTRPVAPVAKKVDGVDVPISLKKQAEYQAQMDRFNITNQQLDSLLVAMYLDPALLNDNIWMGESGRKAKEKAQALLVIEILKDEDKINKEQGLDDLDMSGPARAAILQYEHQAAMLRARNEMKKFEGKPHLFWRKYQPRHNTIATVARRFLCIQSTSCEAERVFSRAGYLTSNCRANLSTSNLRYLLFANSITTALTALQEERARVTNAAKTT